MSILIKMTNLLSFGILIICFVSNAAFQSESRSQQTLSPPRIETSYDEVKNLTTVRLPISRISGDRERYHSLDFSIFYTYEGREKTVPANVKFELVSIVKARKLNTDLYVVFVVDGEKMHFSSNRAAILKPVPERLWIGERFVFLIQFESFKKLAAAKNLAIKMGAMPFDLSDADRESIRKFGEAIAQK